MTKIKKIIKVDWIHGKEYGYARVDCFACCEIEESSYDGANKATLVIGVGEENKIHAPITLEVIEKMEEMLALAKAGLKDE